MFKLAGRPNKLPKVVLPDELVGDALDVLVVAGVEVAGVEVAGVEVAGVEVAGVEVAGVEVA